MPMTRRRRSSHKREFYQLADIFISGLSRRILRLATRMTHLWRLHQSASTHLLPTQISVHFLIDDSRQYFAEAIRCIRGLTDALHARRRLAAVPNAAFNTAQNSHWRIFTCLRSQAGRRGILRYAVLRRERNKCRHQRCKRHHGKRPLPSSILRFLSVWLHGHFQRPVRFRAASRADGDNQPLTAI